MTTGKEKPPAGKAVPAEPGPTSPAGKRTVAAALGRKPSRKTANDMLVLELRRLRAMFSEIAERYVSDTEGEIAAVIEAVEGKPLPTARVERMLKVLHDLSVKPRKGRRKDLARIGRAAAALRRVMGG
jgi:hypothetical protein